MLWLLPPDKREIFNVKLADARLTFERIVAMGLVSEGKNDQECLLFSDFALIVLYAMLLSFSSLLSFPFPSSMIEY